MNEEDIDALSTEEILSHGFVKKSGWYGYKIDENTFVAIDDRKKERAVWGFENGKPMDKEKVLKTILDVFEEAPEAEAEVAVAEAKKTPSEIIDAEIENEFGAIIDAEIKEEFGARIGTNIPVERIAWTEITPDFIRTLREKATAQGLTVEEISKTRCKVRSGIATRELIIDPETGDVIGCDCEKWFFNHNPINPCCEMIFVHDILLEQVRKKVEGEKKEKTKVMEEKAVVKRNVEEKRVSKEVKRKEGVLDFKKRGEYYTVAGKNEPSAWIVQEWSNEVSFDNEIIDWDQDTDHAYALVRVYHSNRQFCDALVNHDFAAIKDVIIFDLIKEAASKGRTIVKEYDIEGKPILTDEAKSRAFERFIRFRNFAVRDCVTKATRIAQLKLLNRDWREEGEKELEEMEVRSVADKS